MNILPARQKQFCFKPLTLLFFWLIVSCTTVNTSLNDLTCEYERQPPGIDTPNPRFSWKIESGERGVYQASYRIIVGKNEKEVLRETGDLWDSGEIQSGNSVNITYEGKPLQSNQNYYWRVCIQTKNGEEIWSEPAFFHTALFNASDWKA
ncbi:MAG: hypothetical protein ACK5HT_03240, partial [Draconibacterium sp.]